MIQLYLYKYPFFILDFEKKKVLECLTKMNKLTFGNKIHDFEKKKVLECLTKMNKLTFGNKIQFQTQVCLKTKFSITMSYFTLSSFSAFPHQNLPKICKV